MSPEDAIEEGQKAQDDAERHYEKVTAKKQAYADAIATQQFESALAMGASYEQAQAEGQAALDMSEEEFEMKENAKKMAQRALDDAEKEFDDTDAERTVYANAVAQQQYEFLLASGYSYQQ